MTRTPSEWWRDLRTLVYRESMQLHWTVEQRHMLHLVLRRMTEIETGKLKGER